jgi:alkylation response protein AidB-like acyl-CoA dehydrogenase
VVDVALKGDSAARRQRYTEAYYIEKLARDAKLLELGAGTTHINYLTAARALLELG